MNNNKRVNVPRNVRPPRQYKTHTTVKCTRLIQNVN